jgi:DNA polymerase-3 subunit epsilon
LVLKANEAELAAHAARLAVLEKASGAAPLWAQMEQA